MTPGTRVIVNYPGYSAHGRRATVIDTFDGELNGHDLGAFVSIRLDDGTEIALLEMNLRALAKEAA